MGPYSTAPLGVVWSWPAMGVQSCFSTDLGSLRFVSVDSDCHFIPVLFEAFFEVFYVYAVSCFMLKKKSKRKVQGVPQSQTAALPRPQEEEETDKSKQAQTEQTHEKH